MRAKEKKREFAKTKDGMNMEMVARKMLASLIAFVLAFSMVPLVPTSALADESGGEAPEGPNASTFGVGGDEVAPALTSIKVSPSTVTKPGAVEVQLGIVEDGTGLCQAFVRLCSDSGKSDAYVFYGEGQDGWRDILYTGSHTFQIPIAAGAHNGGWHVEQIELTDQAGNRRCYIAQNQYDETGSVVDLRLEDGDGGVLPVARFEVKGTSGDEVAPLLTSVKVSPATVSKPGVAEVQLGVVEDGTGLCQAFVRLCSDSGKSDAYVFYGEGQDGWRGVLRTGSHTLKVPVASDAHNGGWHVEQIELTDQAGNRRCYIAQNQYDETGSVVDLRLEDGDGGVLPVARFEVKDEFDYNFAAALSNPQLITKLKSMPEGTAAKIKIDSDKTLPKAAFDAIRGKDKTIVCYDGAIQWIFKGQDITKASKDVQLGIDIGMVVGSDLDVANQLVLLTFAPNGELPGKAQVRFKSDYLYSFQNILGQLRLYYREGAELTQEQGNFDLVFDGTDKWCYMDVTHNSKFIVSPVALKSKKMTDAKITGVGTQYKYTGKSIEPAVKVTLAGVALVKGKDYSVRYESNKEPGVAYVVVTGIGEYKKAGSAKVSFKIVAKTPAKSTKIKLKATKITKLTKGKKSITVKWKKLSKANLKKITGFQIQCSTNKKFKKNVKTKWVKSTKKTKVKVAKLKKKTKYYVRIRTYKKVGKTKYYSSWSKVKAVKTK